MGWNLCSERSQLFPAHQAQKCFREVEIKTFCTLVISHPVAPKILTKLPRICCPPWENVQNSGLSPECGASPCTQPPPDFFFSFGAWFGILPWAFPFRKFNFSEQLQGSFHLNICFGSWNNSPNSLQYFNKVLYLFWTCLIPVSHPQLANCARTTSMFPQP